MGGRCDCEDGVFFSFFYNLCVCVCVCGFLCLPELGLICVRINSMDLTRGHVCVCM